MTGPRHDSLPLAEAGVLVKVLTILSPAQRRRLLLLVPAVILCALLETAGVVAIVPFLALLSDPTAVGRSQMLSWAYDALGFATQERFFFAVGAGLLVLVTVGNVVNALTNWALLHFSWMANHTLGLRLLESYLGRPYGYFLGQNTAELAKNILAEVSSVVGGIVVTLVQLVAKCVGMASILVALLIMNPLMAVGVGGVFGGSYGVLFFFIRKKLSADGRHRLVANEQRFKIAAEALGGVKELKLYGLESLVAQSFQAPSHRFAALQANTAVISQFPRYALESIAFGGVLLIVLALLGAGEALAQALPVLGLYAFAAYKTLPGLQVVFAGLTQIRFNLSSLDLLYRDLHREQPAPPPPFPDQPVEFAQQLEIDDVHFTYANAERAAVGGISLVLRPGEWIAFVGPTGSGKSTLVDLLLGLLRPNRGELRVDGTSVDDAQLQAWQQHVAYVPQQIFLVDDTVARNICFGVPPHLVDDTRMRAAARMAQIDAFIAGELPKGYETLIGERGVRLSGGQRQRLGIARALYRAPRLLVLDEATSALDNETEARFFAALRAASAISVVSIAHRLTTTRGFDRIYVVEGGVVVDQGHYDELVQRNHQFKMAPTQASPAMMRES